MKYLSDYKKVAQSEVFEKYGVFFAFSKAQLEEGMKKVGADENNRVSDFGNGMYALSKNADVIIEALNNIHKDAIAQDIKENGIANIISRELGNYETQLTGDISETVNVLKDYGIKEEQIDKYYKEVFYPLCVENDWF